MDWSSQMFQQVIWPMIANDIGGGELLRMENRPDVELARLLDIRAGIDGWQIRNDGMRGIAARVQTDREYRTFTVRKSRDSGSLTEYAKRCEAIYGNAGLLYPELTVQAYRVVNNEGLVYSAGVTRTKDLFDFIQLGLAGEQRTVNRGAANFYYAEWDAMTKAGFAVLQKRIVEPVGEGQA